MNVIRLVTRFKVKKSSVAERSVLQMNLRGMKPSLFAKATYSTNAKQDIWEVDEICVNDQKLTFKLPVRGKNIDTSSLRKWKIGGEIVKAPFFGQERALTELLHTLWHNIVEEQPDYNYRAALIMKDPQGGKSRFLSEWILQIFNKESVLKSFLEYEPKDTKKNTLDKNAQLKLRKSFLNMIYYSAYRQHMILIDGRSIKSPITRAIVAEFYAEVMVSRFKGMKTKHAEKIISVTQRSFSEKIKDRDFVAALPEMFIELCTQKYPAPTALPFPDAPLLDRQFIVIMIDNYDKIPVGKEAYYCINERKTLYRPCSPVNGLYSIWENAAHKLPYPNFIFTGATIVDERAGDPYHSGFNSISIDNLLDRRYLAQLTEVIFKHRWPITFDGIAVTSELPMLDSRVADVLLRNFLRAFGNPTAIKELVAAAYEPTMKAIKLIEDIAKQSNKENEDRLIECLEDLEKKLEKVLMERVKKGNSEFNFEVTQNFSMRTAIFRPTFMDGRYPTSSGNTYVRDLVAARQLSLFQLGKTDMTVAYPFYTWSHEQLRKPIRIDFPKANVSSSELWTPYEISHASLMLDPQCARVLFGDSSKGVPIEEALASAIYVRHRIERMKIWKNHSLTSVSLCHWIGHESLKRLNVDHDLGIVQLKKSWRNFNVFDEILKHQVIAIDNATHKNFTYVLLPVRTNYDTIRGIMLIRCCNDSTKTAEELAKADEFTNPMILSQITISPFVHSITEISDTVAVVPASMFVSPLYLIGMSFFHRQELVVANASHTLPYYRSRLEQKK